MPDDLGPLDIEPEGERHLDKVGGARPADEGEPDETIAVTVKVSEAGYVPEAVERRMAVSDTIFTADVRRRDLAVLDDDPRVVAVETSRRLQQ